MFKDLLARLLAPEPVLSDPDARLAMAALLVRLARTDGHYAPEEIARIDRILEARYDLDHAGAQALRRHGETLEEEAPDTVRFTRAIKEAVPYEERVSVISALWSVALADGVRDAEEDALMRLAANLLGVSDIASAQARQGATRS
ncbi:MAG: TerB family tellurite resistance protein [Rhodobacteraceae bacterium]|jgi:uncharacterized tellurite resistance protein B-like protein|nr:TerB family tellurite resistance protein [Paracoccaceae bacterium]